MDRYYSTNTH
jgi:hypothetical protein